MIPSVGTPIACWDIFNGFFERYSLETFAGTIAKEAGRRYCLFANSGTAAFFLILEALKKLSNRKGVILPAYTAPSLILPIRRAGLIPRLCDIDLTTFNMDVAALSQIITDDTLAITLVHMFGLPQGFSQNKGQAPFRDIFLIEDLASAQGTTIYGKAVGSLGDVSFMSFNRGKNFSTVNGGAILVDREDIARIVGSESTRYLQRPSLKTQLGIIGKAIVLSLAVRPWFYTIFRSLIAPFKYQGLHQTFALSAYTRFQAGMGDAALRSKGEWISDRRFQHGLYLHRALSRVRGINLPVIPDGAIPVFNQFPLLVKDPVLRNRIVNRLIKGGIEATTLYPEPIHTIYDLGYDREPDPFPNATYLARRLILIPTHPYVTETHLKKAVEIIQKYL
jgi:perosamine synthetase